MDFWVIPKNRLWSLCGTIRSIWWRKDDPGTDLRWPGPANGWVSKSLNPVVPEVGLWPPGVFWSPEMKEAAQAMKRVNSELLTPLGDEDILDWREIVGNATFCSKIFPDRLDIKDCLDHRLICANIGEIRVEICMGFIGNLALILINVWSGGRLKKGESLRRESHPNDGLR